MPANESPRTRLLAVLSLSIVPWTALFIDGHVTLVMPWGLLDPVGPHVTLLPEYLGATGSGPPPFLFSWPLGVAIYMLALGCVVLEWFDRGDPRVTGGLLVVVGVTQLTVAWGLVGRGEYTVVAPLGTIVAWTLAWWFYWPDLRTIGRPAHGP